MTVPVTGQGAAIEPFSVDPVSSPTCWLRTVLSSQVSYSWSSLAAAVCAAPVVSLAQPAEHLTQGYGGGGAPRLGESCTVCMAGVCGQATLLPYQCQLYLPATHRTDFPAYSPQALPSW